MATLEELRAQLHSKLQKYQKCFEGITVTVEEVKCPHCGNLNLVVDYQRGEVICPRCGTVVLDHLPDVAHPEYRIFSPEDVEELEHYHRIDHDTDLGTSVKYLDSKLRKVAKRVRPRIEVARYELERYFRKLVSSDVILNELVNIALYLYKRYHEVYNQRIPSFKHLAAAVAILVLKRDKDEVFRMLGLDEELQRCGYSRVKFKTLLARLKTLLPLRFRVVTKTVYLDQVERLIVQAYEKLSETFKFLKDLEARRLILQFALDLARKLVLETNLCTGRKPRSVAAACLFLSTYLFERCFTATEHIREDHVARAVGVDPNTLRSFLKIVKEKINIVVEV